MKANAKEYIQKYPYEMWIDIAYRTGIKEVVDTVWWHSEYNEKRTDLILDLLNWKEALKEWGVE